MGDTSFPARYTATLDMLNTTSQNMFTQYSQIQSSSASLVSQNTELQTEVQALNSKLANMKKVSDTFDREFLDRSASKPAFGFWQSRGVNTLQDWIFMIFFIIYAVVCLMIFGIVAQQTIVGGVLVLIVSVVLGIMMSLVIMMFA
jgi:uncharacterized membrane protein